MENNVYRACPVRNALNIEALYTFSCRRFPDGYSFKGETHDFAEAVCVTDGKAGITAGKNVYVLSAGQMILHPPGEFHAIWSDGGAEPETVIFSFRSASLPELATRVYTLSPERISEIKSVYRAAENAFVLSGNDVAGIREGRNTEASARRQAAGIVSPLRPLGAQRRPSPICRPGGRKLYPHPLRHGKQHGRTARHGGARQTLQHERSRPRKDGTAVFGMRRDGAL